MASSVHLPRFRVEPLCFSISVEDFQRWLKVSAPRAVILYAHGSVLDPKREVVLLARAAGEAGKVELFQRRRDGGGFNYHARRVAPSVQPGSDDIAVTPRLKRVEPDAESDAGQVLALLRRHANFGLPCPTNREIAVKLRISDAARVRYLIGQLVGEGHISVLSRGQRVTRIVTIAATGKQTSLARTPVGAGFQSGGGE